ncbi:MAG: replication initiation protein [Candidatus Bipolaricaulota bacterium]|nr:replication initiation protein [Candidatus Bipolaricaulota bacterium]
MEIVTIEDNKNNVVIKHQELIRTARYRLSELGIKVVSVLVSMIKVSDADFQEYIIKVNDFKELIGSTSKKTYEYVDVMTDELMKKPFKVGDEKFNWVYYAKYKEGDNAVVLKIAPELKPYLLNLKQNFLEYNIINILPLKSGYVIRLYELCKDHYSEGTRYKKSNQSVTFDIKIERLRELFEIPKSYQYSSHIKKLILEKAAIQFKEKTDIQITYQEQKIGRKVDRVIITVRENNKGSNDYFKNRHAFIEHMRANFVNQDIYQGKDKHTGRFMKISIAPDGKLYDKTGHEFEASRSDEMWSSLFKLAQNDQLLCLKQGTLF